jgi:hypothetical protein
MLEEMLAYTSRTRLADSSSELPPAELDNDARLFYHRMATDIAVVAAGVDRQTHRARIVKTLRAALAAPLAAGAAAWQQLYREIFALVAVSYAEAAPGEVRTELLGSRDRLSHFVSENIDLADAPAIEELERMILAHVGANAAAH